jgi:hypothetical protein
MKIGEGVERRIYCRARLFTKFSLDRSFSIKTRDFDATISPDSLRGPCAKSKTSSFNNFFDMNKQPVSVVRKASQRHLRSY